MTARRIPYTVNARGAGLACAVCRAKLAEGDAAISVWNPDGLSWHQHADCSPAAPAGGGLADRLMADIRAGKPPVNPDPEHAKRKVQGS